MRVFTVASRHMMCSMWKLTPNKTRRINVSPQQTVLLSADRVVNSTQIAAIFDLFVGIDVHSLLEVTVFWESYFSLLFSHLTISRLRRRESPFWESYFSLLFSHLTISRLRRRESPFWESYFSLLFSHLTISRLRRREYRRIVTEVTISQYSRRLRRLIVLV